MKLTRRELRDVAISLRVSKSERDNLTRLTQHYQTSNADLIVWLVASELERVAGASGEVASAPKGLVSQTDGDQSIKAVLTQLEEQVAKLRTLVEGQNRGSRTD